MVALARSLAIRAVTSSNQVLVATAMSGGQNRVEPVAADHLGDLVVARDAYRRSERCALELERFLAGYERGFVDRRGYGVPAPLGAHLDRWAARAGWEQRSADGAESPLWPAGLAVDDPVERLNLVVGTRHPGALVGSVIVGVHRDDQACGGPEVVDDGEPAMLRVEHAGGGADLLVELAPAVALDLPAGRAHGLGEPGVIDSVGDGQAQLQLGQGGVRVPQRHELTSPLRRARPGRPARRGRGRTRRPTAPCQARRARCWRTVRRVAGRSPRSLSGGNARGRRRSRPAARRGAAP